MEKADKTAILRMGTFGLVNKAHNTCTIPGGFQRAWDRPRWARPAQGERLFSALHCVSGARKDQLRGFWGLWAGDIL